MDAESFLSTLCTAEAQHKLVKWLQREHILKGIASCDICGRQKKLLRRTYRLDGTIWFCRTCCSETSVRKGSLFELFPKTPLYLILHFMHDWCKDMLMKQMDTKLSRNTKTSLSKTLRRVVCSDFRRSKMMLSGTVAIDESLFTRRKYHRGRFLRRKQRWVLGMVELDTGRTFLQPVHDRRGKTLTGIIRKHVRRGSTIVTDLWAGYRSLSHARSPYLHLTVNHSQNFVDPRTGAHTNHIEGMWSVVKRFLRNKCVRTSEDLDEWLGVFMWRKDKVDSLLFHLISAMGKEC